MSSIDAKWPETPSVTSKWHTFTDWQNPLETSSRFFENQPQNLQSFVRKSVKSHVSQAEKLQNHSNERKGKKKRKERGEGKEEKIKNQLKTFVKLHKVSKIVKHYNMKYTLYYAHAKLKSVKGKRLRGNTGIVHLSIVRWNLLRRNIQ